MATRIEQKQVWGRLGWAAMPAPFPAVGRCLAQEPQLVRQIPNGERHTELLHRLIEHDAVDLCVADVNGLL